VDVPMARVPVANWVLIGVTSLVTIAVWVHEARTADRDDQEPEYPLALKPADFSPTQLVTYQFVHADILHLAGNMMFLFVFGNAVNAKLGHWQFVVIYLLLGVLAGAAFIPFAGGLPVLGASGAIMGIVGVFLVLFPRNDVQVFYWFGL